MGRNTKNIFCKISSVIAIGIFILLSQATAKTVKYELTVTQQNVNLSGHKTVDWALMVNGQIPAPTLEFTEGDEAEILVKNQLAHEEVSIHWHGLLLPPEEDGVAYLNTPPIFPGQSRLFKFKIRQHGTYWYHSHTAVQEQKGVYGAFVIHPKKETIKADKEFVVVLSDWSDENADQIIKNLRKDGDYYLYKKDSVRSIFGAAQAGSLKNYFSNEWQRMGGMDLSDVGYDAFLINGKKDSQLLTAHPGEKIRIRIINAGASSYFYVSLGDIPMKVISADGVDIEPIHAQELLMGMAETYDILFTVPDHKNYELRATAQDVTGYASGWIGMGERVPARDKETPNMYATMDHGSLAQHANHAEHSEHSMHNMEHSGHEGHKTQEIEEADVETMTVDHMKSLQPTTLPVTAKVTDLKLVLGGDMERYVWHINGKAIHEDRDIPINEGDIVRFTFENETMMHHPMHLHGHFFRVLNANGEKSPLKHTVDVPPHGSRTIEFYANEPGRWMLHCHNLYHMKTGMARVVKYMSYKPSEEIQMHEKHDPHNHEHIYSLTQAAVATNQTQFNFKLMRTKDELDLTLESRSEGNKNFSTEGNWDLEGDFFYRRWSSNYLNFFGGASSFKDKGYGMVGLGYVLPLLIESRVMLSHEGKLRLDLEKKFQWTKSLFTDVDYIWRPNWNSEHEGEYKITLMYGPSWSWATGVVLTNSNLGFGGQIRF